MEETSKDHYQAALLEDMNDKFSMILEILLPLVEKVNDIDLRLKSIEVDVKIIKAVVKAHSWELHGRKTRITTLEAKAMN